MRSNRDPFRQALFAGLVSFVAVFATTCAVFAPKPKPQEWDEDAWGPLVPHKTFPADCSICHVPDRWDVLKPDFSFDHAKETGVKLEGAHATAACLRCHNDFGPVKEYVERGCTGCHLDVHRSQLGKKCLECHTMNDWRPAGILAQHAQTRFPLTGAHIAVACELCHQLAPTGTYRGAPTQCQICHADDALRSQSFDHQANGWTTRCERCHFPTGWKGANFTHAFFPLTGGHAGLACTECHPGNDFRPIPTDCFSCHSDDFNGAPNHTSGGYSHDCLRCHTRDTWEGARFDHTFFPLTGGHAGLACIDCHTSGVTGPIPSACISCHQDDFNGAPDHVAGGYSTDCLKCHTTTTFEGAVFDHSFFPLTNGHAGHACTDCHTSGTTGPIPNTCVSCHLADYQGAPNHQSFPQTCQQCHTTTTWKGATFNHTAFPLSGPHNVSCNQCHPGGDSSTFDCLTCHGKTETDGHHREVRNYQYSSTACYQCHRNGRADD
ncbi:MAG TPA: hypothetical protein VFY93_11910 [Planctomycetota bacterium]|nr:hypothetical protein [Planctomycetota bacterium]